MSQVKLTVYWYPQCSTCRDAVKWLEKHNVGAGYTVLIDMVQTPPSKPLLKKLLKQSGLPMQRFFNTSGELYREFKLSGKLPSLDEEQALDLLSEHGKIIKRPLIFSDTAVTVGFK